MKKVVGAAKRKVLKTEAYFQTRYPYEKHVTVEDVRRYLPAIDPVQITAEILSTLSDELLAIPNFEADVWSYVRTAVSIDRITAD